LAGVAECGRWRARVGIGERRGVGRKRW
jgi:hypothetical protein